MKVHKSLRIDEGTARRVEALKREDESDAAAYGRVLEAGADALEAGEAKREPRGGQEAAPALVEALQAHIDTLAEQIATKDRQIETLSRLADQAQRLHATEAAKALEAPAEERPEEQAGRRRGLFARLLNR